ncbi:MAG: hypothetical protein H7Z19_19960, partial [Chitinophagaceae bacterium]|nr:hypothetical protein [Rubrivivax sp.]
MKSFPAANPGLNALHSLTVLAFAALLSGCTSMDGLFGGSKVDYKSAAAKTSQLEVPPDLSQLSRDSRYQPQGGVVSALAAAAGPTAGNAVETGAP